MHELVTSSGANSAHTLRDEWLEEHEINGLQLLDTTGGSYDTEDH